MAHKSILLPGVVLPKELAYGDLVDALGPGIDAHPKDLEVYATPGTPAGYGLDAEINAVLRDADARGFDRFHLVGYSAGGAISAALTAKHPDRLLSLALLEPAWFGNEGLSAEEIEAREEVERIGRLPFAEMMPRFVELQLAPGVEPPAPPPGPTPDWMATRPAGIAAVVEAFRVYDLDLSNLGAFEAPVYYALGSLSNPSLYRSVADRAARVFPDFTLEVYENRHHFDPPHRAEPERLAERLRDLWDRGAERERA